jgi:hypothetical protein
MPVSPGYPGPVPDPLNKRPISLPKEWACLSFPILGSPATDRWRAGGFASHPFERFAFFPPCPYSNFHATILGKTQAYRIVPIRHKETQAVGQTAQIEAGKKHFLWVPLIPSLRKGAVTRDSSCDNMKLTLCQRHDGIVFYAFPADCWARERHQSSLKKHSPTDITPRAICFLYYENYVPLNSSEEKKNCLNAFDWHASC